MANHSYLKNMKNPITPEELERELHTINERHFANSLTIERWENPQDEEAAWTLFLNDTTGFQLWLNDGHNIEAPHSLGWANAFHWAQDVILVTLRASHGGAVHDDAVEEALFDDCELDAIDTYVKWWRRAYSFFPTEKQKLFWDGMMLDAPSDLKAFINAPTEFE